MRKSYNFEMQRYSLLNIATDLLQLGKLDEAMDYLEKLKTIKVGAEFTHFRYFNRYLLLMSELNLVQNAFAQAVELAQEARKMANIYGNLKNISKGHWLESLALAGMNHNAEAIEHLGKAVAVADQIHHGSLRWKVRVSLAEAMTRAGRSPTDVLQQARTLVNQTIRTVVHSPLEQAFLTSPWLTRLLSLEQNLAPQTPGYPAGLTQREVEVLRLVASGATNQHIADVLHISVRTVHAHIGNILNKTNCDNRTAATAFAMQHNLLSR